MASTLVTLFSLFLGAFTLLVLLLIVQAIQVWKRIKPTPRKTIRSGTVVLHQMPPNNRVLNVSPPCVKLETYFRMNKIPYQSEFSFSRSSKGKVPWIEYNGNAVGDSNFIIQYFNEEFNIDPDAHLTAVERAIAHAMMVTLEENTYWTLMYHCFVADLPDTRVMSPLLGVMPNPLQSITSWLFSRHIEKTLWSHGIGRHSQEEIYSIAEKDLRAVSQLLGKKKYVMGNMPSLLDAVVFGLLSVVLWNTPSSPQARLIRSELKNLEMHCYNMREEYFPDWEQIMLANKLK